MTIKSILRANITSKGNFYNPMLTNSLYGSMNQCSNKPMIDRIE